MSLTTLLPAGRTRRLALAVPTLLLAVSLAACSGDDGGDGGGDGGGDDAPALSKDDFVDQANDICATGNEELEAAGQEVDQTDPEAIPMFATDVLVPNIRGQLDDIRALGFPEGDEELLGGILDDASAAIDEVEANPMLLATGPNPFEDVNPALVDYGLGECGSS